MEFADFAHPVLVDFTELFGDVTTPAEAALLLAAEPWFDRPDPDEIDNALRGSVTALLSHLQNAAARTVDLTIEEQAGVLSGLRRAARALEVLNQVVPAHVLAAHAVFAEQRKLWLEQHGHPAAALAASRPSC